jgi:hypothetical protein
MHVKILLRSRPNLDFPHLFMRRSVHHHDKVSSKICRSDSFIYVVINRSINDIYFGSKGNHVQERSTSNLPEAMEMPSGITCSTLASPFHLMCCHITSTARRIWRLIDVPSTNDTCSESKLERACYLGEKEVSSLIRGFCIT